MIIEELVEEQIEQLKMEKAEKGAIVCNIARKVPLFKDTEMATKIELVYLEELEYPVVVEKDFYKVGEEVVFIKPDYCVSDTPIFQEYIRPDGDITKSKLGKINGIPLRIRAKKFNLHTGDGYPIYSYGIILPAIEVKKLLSENREFLAEVRIDNPNEPTIDQILKITKYEEPDSKEEGMYSGEYNLPFPEGLYKTDEVNFLSIANRIRFPITLIGTQKVDGSSITIGVCPSHPEGFICSRKQRKKLIIKRKVGFRHLFNNSKYNWIEKVIDFMYAKFFGVQRDRCIYEEKENDDTFVKVGLPYLKDLLAMKNNLILRGELNGKSCKGSGNKNNPSAKKEINIEFFGIDKEVRKGVYEKVDYKTFSETLSELWLNSYLEYFPCLVLFQKTFNSKEEIIKACEDVFKDYLIEGIVLKTPDSKFSAKYMNLEYDSKK